jgi:CRISPR-associated endonuclease Csn1
MESIRFIDMNANIISKSQRNENLGTLTFGFDIGIASVGWAVLNETRVVALGVRAFDKAETAKEGDSLNLVRRSARLMRRRLRRRAWRLTRLGRLLKRFGVIENADYFKTQPGHTDSAWNLRIAALDRRLTSEEWARVLYHLCKHRGFYWVSRAEEAKAEGDATGEAGKVKKNLAATAKLMATHGYRTAAQMVLAEFPDAQRNKQGEYTKALSRILLGEELNTLFEAQRSFGSQYASPTLELEILGTGDKKSGLFWLQKPSLTGNKLLEMLGHCTFEKSEYRAAKASFTAERHVWLTRLNNVRITVDGKSRPLNDAERAVALLLPYKSGEKFTYKNLRTALVAAGLDTTFKFTGFSYPSAQQIEEKKAKNPEDDVMVKLSAWHELRLKLNRAGLESEWLQISTPALDGDASLLDQIGWVLSVYKEDEEVKNELSKLLLPGGETTINALLTIRFDKFHALSLTALRKIVPFMESGLRYDEAVAKIPEYGHHSQLYKVGKGSHRLLPPLYKERDKTGKLILNEDLDVPRNPVVLRSINQSPKVLNALVKEYGSPSAVHIELARDLSRPFDERKKIKTEQDAFRDRNDKDRDEFASHPQFASYMQANGKPKGKDFEKWRLYNEQQGKCAYSLEGFDLNRLLEPGYVEVDHALPYSRSFDDSKNNKVLVFAKVNRDKGNLTPYEYLDGKNDSQVWRDFVGFAQGNKAWRQAKLGRLLRKDFGKDESQEFRDRNLNDTRYIAKFFKNYVEQYLKLEKQADGSQAQRCVVLSGQLTAFLRARWGFIKIREESDRHHALDAVVIAACSHSMVKKLSDYSRNKELAQVKEGFVDMETGEIVNPAMFTQLNAHFPAPWPDFRDEVVDRLKIDDPALLSIAMQRLSKYPAEALEQLKPLFVSRAPQRRNSGAVHKDTIYAQPERLKKQGGVTQKVALSSLSLKDIDKLAEPHRNVKLYEAIRVWLGTRDANEKRAKEIEASAGRGKDKRALTSQERAEIDTLRALPRKPTNDSTQIGPIIRTVTMDVDKLSGIPIRGGIAKNDTMLRVDVFTKAGKFHIVPVYIHHLVSGLPTHAVVANKDETEWTLIDDGFTFCFSLCPNDFVRVQQNGKPKIEGYFAGCDRSTGNLSFWSHDRSETVGKDGLIRSIGVKTALSLEKFDVDVLGNIYPAKPEERRGLA